MDIKKGNIGNALHSIAPDHVVTTADEVFDENQNRYQNDINSDISSDISNIEANIGYYECNTEASTAAKTLSASGYNLMVGGAIKVKFANKNTANNATLNINSQGAKALYYHGERASATNSWDAEEVVEIYYDGESYYANNVKGGSGSGVYDVSVEHPNSGPNGDGKFTIEYILNPSNVNELIPVNKRYPGMSIQFVYTSDNKYIQARCMAQNFTTDVTQWQVVDGEITAGSKNIAESGAVEAALRYDLQTMPMLISKYAIQVDTWIASYRNHIVIPVEGGESVSWSGIDTLYYALLTAYPSIPKDGDIPEFLNGYTGRQSATEPIVIPEGCKYLIVNAPNSYTSIVVNGYDVLRGVAYAAFHKVNLSGLATDVMSLLATFELSENKKSEITRENAINTNYFSARALYELFQNIKSGINVNGLSNLFVTKLRGVIPTTGVVPTTDIPTSSYSVTDYIPVSQGHKYFFNLKGTANILNIAEYDSNKDFIQGNNGSVQKGIFTPSPTTAYVCLCANNQTLNNAALLDVTDRIYALIDDILVHSIETRITSYNIANPKNIRNGIVNSNGGIQDSTTWKLIEIPVNGTKLSFGGFYLGRSGYAAFYNDNNEKVGSTINFSDPNGTYNDSTKNINIPSGATKIYIDIASPNSPSDPYSQLMVNYGSNLRTYEEYKEVIVSINGDSFEGVDPELISRVGTLEGDVTTLEGKVTTLEGKVDILENIDIVEDLPVSDGTDIDTGYAYIDSSTGVVKIKMS